MIGRAALVLALLLAAPVQAATVLTGDRIDGVPVVETLDVADLPAGQVSRFYFRVVDQAAGQGWYVPVLVAKGGRPGKRLLLTAAIHGDELNGVGIIHRLFAGLEVKTMAGTVVAIPGLNTPGILNSTRTYSPSLNAGGSNLNRQMPGKLTGNEVGEFVAARIWNQLMIANADQAIDLHTQSWGTVYPMFVFAQTAQARRIADLLAPDVIRMDAGVNGTVENMLNDAGVPAVTLELGGPQQFDPVMISRGVAGVRNVMADMGILAGPATRAGAAPFVGNHSVDVVAPRGGYAQVLVKLGDKVAAGQTVALITDPFGATTATLTAPNAGQVVSLATAPTREVGSLLVRILSWDDAEVCKADGCGVVVR